MDAYQAYTMYLALKRHFTVGSNYDYFKYNGKTNASKRAFETRKDRYSFHKLSKKSDPEGYMVANFVAHGPNIWIMNLVNDQKYEETYIAWLKRKESMSYIFKSEIEKLEDLDKDLRSENGDYPRLLQLYIRNQVSIETMIILSDLAGFFKSWNKTISDPVIWPEIYNTCVKYKPFVKYDVDKLRKIAVETLC